MNTLVVQAHPLDESYNGALFERVRAGLRTAGDAFTTVRLGEGDSVEPADLDGVARLVLVYPTWWGGLPAVLLEWVQTVLAEGALGAVAQVDVVTTHGSSRLVNFVQGAWGRSYLERRLRASCARGCGFSWHALYEIDRCSAAELEQFLAVTEERFAASR